MLPRKLSPADAPALHALLSDYAAFLTSIDAMDCGGNVLLRELDQLDACYQGAHEGWFAIYDDTRPIACAALSEMEPGIGEICRMYVGPAYRGKGLARQLLEHVLTQARAWGYQRLYLDTFRQPDDARHLYEKLGFTPCPPYHDGPAHKLLFFTLAFASNQE